MSTETNRLLFVAEQEYSLEECHLHGWVMLVHLAEPILETLITGQFQVQQCHLQLIRQNLRDTVNKYGGTAASATHEVDIVDNNFKLPTIWAKHATDIKFGKGYKLIA